MQLRRIVADNRVGAHTAQCLVLSLAANRGSRLFRSSEAVPTALTFQFSPKPDSSGERRNGSHAARLEVGDRLVNLLLRVHYKWAIADNGFVDPLPVHHE